MPVDTKSSRKKSKRLPKEALLIGEKSEKEQRHYEGVILEDIQDKMNRVIEVVEMNRESQSAEMKAMEERLTSRLETVEMVVRSHSGQIQNLDKKVGELDKKVDQLQVDVTGITVRLDRVEERLDRVETKLDRVVDKVDQHGKEMAHLKSAVFAQ